MLIAKGDLPQRFLVEQRIVRHTQTVKPLVGKKGSVVATDTVGLSTEELHAAHRAGRLIGLAAGECRADASQQAPHVGQVDLPVAVRVEAEIVCSVGCADSEGVNLVDQITSVDRRVGRRIAGQHIETKAVESKGATCWSDLAAQCGKRGGHLRMGNRITEFTNLNPPTINQVIQFSITAEVLSGLVQLDPDLNPAPDLAESWSVSDDLMTFTFKLRQNAKYHTGRQFTADNVVFTYDNQLDPDTQSIHTNGLEGVNRPVQSDDLTVEISPAFPRASFLT